MITVKDISDYINTIAPYNTKCEWDNCGILVGNPSKQTKKIGFTLDLTPETLGFAVENGIDLIVTHHPVIFKAQKSFVHGNIAYEAAVNSVSVISAHTCFDCADGGVNDVLCDILGLSEVRAIESDECVVPMLRMGSIGEISPVDFAKFTAKKLGTTVRLVDANKPISRVAVCGGAGLSFLSDVINAGVDAYVTGDISHHEMLEASDSGITVVAAGHFETEYPSMTALMKKVKDRFSDAECVVIPQSNPIKFIG